MEVAWDEYLEAGGLPGTLSRGAFQYAWNECHKQARERQATTVIINSMTAHVLLKAQLKFENGEKYFVKFSKTYDHTIPIAAGQECEVEPNSCGIVENVCFDFELNTQHVYITDVGWDVKTGLSLNDEVGKCAEYMARFGWKVLGENLRRKGHGFIE